MQLANGIGIAFAPDESENILRQSGMSVKAIHKVMIDTWKSRANVEGQGLRRG